MHELALCQGLIGQVERVAAAHGARKVTKISLRIGPLGGAEPDLLRSAYTIARAGTVASDAELAIELSGVRVSCTQCGAEGEATVNALLCPACGDWRVRLLSGDELLLTSVELQKPEAAVA